MVDINRITVTETKTKGTNDNPIQMSDFQLIIGESDGEIQNGDVPVRWCVSPELIKQMEQDKINDPHIFILAVTKLTKYDISTSCYEMSRQLVPLSELMTYVRFTRAGQCYVHAWILNGNYGRKQMELAYIRKGSEGFITDLMQSATTPYFNLNSLPYAYKHTMEGVIIPDGVFGKEPPGWLKWYANLWYETTPDDECAFRQRMLLAFILKWIPVGFFIIFNVIARVTVNGLWTLAGYRTLTNWKSVIHPFSIPIDDSFELGDMVRDNSMLIKSTRHGYNIYNVTFFPFTPLIVLIIYIFGYSITNDVIDATFHTIKVLTIAVSISATFDLLRLFVYLIGYTPKWAKRRFSKIDNWITEKKIGPQVFIGTSIAMVLMLIGVIIYAFILAPMFTLSLILIIIMMIIPLYAFVKFDEWNLQQNDYENMRELLCPMDKLNLSTRPQDLERRSVRLRYKELKHKVCKPMQR